MSSKNCLIVLFGGQSAEHYVSCVSARHVIEAANPELYDVIPVGIDRNGDWHLAEKAIEDLGTGNLGKALEPAGPMWNPMTQLAIAPLKKLLFFLYFMVHSVKMEQFKDFWKLWMCHI